MYKIKLKDVIPYFFMVPAISIGTMAMISYGVTPNILFQNIISWVVTSVLCCIFIAKTNKNYASKNIFNIHMIIAILVIFLLIIPFLFEGLNGVHRWVVCGPIRLYISNIFLPLMIISLWNLLLRHHTFFSLTLMATTLLILLFHPDAGQVTAFACASIVMVLKQISNKLLKTIYVVLTAAIIILSWVFLDDLAPVPYVEQIIFLVVDMGKIWLVPSLISFALLLLPFFIINKSILSVSLGIYFLATILVTFFGNFPVPIMGYGISPIISYVFSITILNSENKCPSR